MRAITAPIPVQFGRFKPSITVDEGRMLNASGALTATVSSRQSGKHVTIRLRCSRRNPDGVKRWPTVPFDQATHLFIDSFDSEPLASYEVERGVLRFAPLAAPAARWTITQLLRYLAGVDTKLIEQAELQVMSHCLKCGRELTNPESIERGYGPECWGENTRSVRERITTTK